VDLSAQSRLEPRHPYHQKGPSGRVGLPHLLGQFLREDPADPWDQLRRYLPHPLDLEYLQGQWGR
jgi:hypothetical protein